MFLDIPRNPSKVLIASLLFGGLLGCARQTPLLPHRGLSLLSPEIKSALKKVERSIVGINTEVIYEIQKFEYLIENGELVADPTSPLKYKLAVTNNNGVKIETDKQTLSGGGLIIDIDNLNSKYTILTSSHLIAPEDSTDVYYVDENGTQTDILFARYLLKSLKVFVLNNNIWSVEAKTIADNRATDLAIIQAEGSNILGVEFKNQLGYDIDLGWGDWVFLFGYPKGIKQMTGGWVSKSPYPRTVAVDAVVRFGYSGGPVFTFSKDRTELAFVGVIKSVPRTNLIYIAPDQTLPVGSSLHSQDLPKLSVKRAILVNYGTAYFVDSKSIKSFLNSARNTMNDFGISLARKFYGN